MIEYVDKDYPVQKELGMIQKYVLTKEDFQPVKGYNEKQDQIMLQGYGFDEYIGQLIEVYALVVEGHEAEDSFKGKNKGTIVYIMTSDNQVIGGYSYINFKFMAPGGYSGLRGESIEDIYDIDYKDFRKEWYSHYEKILDVD